MVPEPRDLPAPYPLPLLLSLSETVLANPTAELDGHFQQNSTGYLLSTIVY